MSDLTPRIPNKSLLWPDIVSGLQNLLRDVNVPVYIVGGAVRDAYLHRPIKDIDIATPGDSVRLARQIADLLCGDVFVLDAVRGVARVLVHTPAGRLMLDVARCRGDSLLDDLLYRDFTVNAMAVNLPGDLALLIDPLGGEEDIEKKQIRRCSSQAIAADPIRALRAIRQSVQLGMRIESETLRDIRTHGAQIVETSAERVRDEFINLLTVAKPAAALSVADAIGLLELIVPEIKPLHGLEQPPPHIFDAWRHTLNVIESLHSILFAISPARTDNTAAAFSLGMMTIQLDRYRHQLISHIETSWADERPHHALIMLAALLHDTGKPVAGFDKHETAGAGLVSNRAGALRLSNAEKHRLTAIIHHQAHPSLLAELTPLAIHRFWRQLGIAGVDVCLLALANYLGTVGRELDQDYWLRLVERIRFLLNAYYEQYDQLVAPPPLLDGRQLIQLLEIQPGPLVGELLNVIREGQATSKVQSVDDALLTARLYLSENT